MSVFDQLREAARLNKTGAEFLQSNQCEKAHASFKDALRILTNFTYLQLEGRQAERTSMLYSAIPLNIEDKSFFVYNKALIFNPTACETSNNVVFFVAMIVMNTGLAHHQQAMRVGENSAAHLIKAQVMYERVNDIAAAFPQEGQNVTSDLDIHALQVLARNNHTHICNVLSEFQQFEAGLQDVEYQLSKFHRSACKSVLLFQDYSVIEELFLNLLIRGKCTAAPCA